MYDSISSHAFSPLPFLTPLEAGFLHLFSHLKLCCMWRGSWRKHFIRPSLFSSFVMWHFSSYRGLSWDGFNLFIRRRWVLRLEMREIFQVYCVSSSSSSFPISGFLYFCFHTVFAMLKVRSDKANIWR